MKLREVVLTLPVAALLGMLVGCGESSSTGDAAEAAPVAETAPAITELPELDLAGLEALIDESAAADRVLVIDFWATWCLPCLEMLPGIHDGVNAMGDDVRGITVTWDDRGEYEQRAIAFLAEHHALDHAYIMPEPRQQEAVVRTLGQRWNAVVVPAILVFDKQGQQRGEFLDGGVTDQVLQLARQLAEADPPPPDEDGG